MVGLFDDEKKFLGLGVLLQIDSERKRIKVLTPVKEKPNTISIGRVEMDDSLRETHSS